MNTLPQQLTITEQQHIRNNLSRAQSLLKRNDTLRGLEALIDSLSGYDPKRVPSRTRFEIDTALLECVKDIGTQPLVQTFLREILKSKDANISYTVGKPALLKHTLEILRKGIQGDLDAAEKNEHDAREARRASLIEKGLASLKSGDAPKGKASLRIYADEFGEEDGVYRQVGMWLLEYNHPMDAVEFLEVAIENFPKDSKAYGAAAQAYTQMGEWAKAEAVYIKAIKQFGKHPRTLLNLANVYIKWNKRDNAFRYALEAYNADNSLTEAKEIVEKYG